MERFRCSFSINFELCKFMVIMCSCCVWIWKRIIRGITLPPGFLWLLKCRLTFWATFSVWNCSKFWKKLIFRNSHSSRTKIPLSNTQSVVAPSVPYNNHRPILINELIMKISRSFLAGSPIVTDVFSPHANRLIFHHFHTPLEVYTILFSTNSFISSSFPINLANELTKKKSLLGLLLAQFYLKVLELICWNLSVHTGNCGVRRKFS